MRQSERMTVLSISQASSVDWGHGGFCVGPKPAATTGRPESAALSTPVHDAPGSDSSIVCLRWAATMVLTGWNPYPYPYHHLLRSRLFYSCPG